uniref:Uncharacterized protein n=1 Tax=Physcomitrium patens TaxID=3218 RepID=A0A2K1IGY1_PHYPA|nr:hypothetical protein PHYPA_029129 [Physcomitrium patens]
MDSDGGEKKQRWEVVQGTANLFAPVMIDIIYARQYATLHAVSNVAVSKQCQSDFPSKRPGKNGIDFAVRRHINYLNGALDESGGPLGCLQT